MRFRVVSAAKQPAAQSSNSGGYVNSSLIKQIANNTAPIPAATAAFAGAAVGGGLACAALCPAAAAAPLTTLGVGGAGAAESAAANPEQAAEVAEAVGTKATQLSEGAQKVVDWLEPNATTVKSGSDLMIRSADGTRTIRFDLINSHGDDPHINVQTWQETIRGWVETSPNEHIYPN